MPFQYLLFDVDDTLFDTYHAHREAHRAVCNKFLFPDRDDDFKLFMEINDALWLKFNQGLVSQKFLLVERYRQFFNAIGIHGDPNIANQCHLNAYANNMVLLPDALEVISTLSKNHKIYLITNAVTFVHKLRMENSPINPFIEQSFMSEEIGYQKPSKEFFDYVFSHIDGITKSNSLVIGDSLSSDIIGAIQYGISCCWYNAKEQQMPDYLHIDKTIHNLKSLLNFINY